MAGPASPTQSGRVVIVLTARPAGFERVVAVRADRVPGRAMPQSTRVHATTNDATDTLRRLLADGALDLPTPATGNTAARHLGLFELARHHSVSVARLAEAHTDAIAILAEAGRAPQAGALYGVWASVAPHPPVAPVRGELRHPAGNCLLLTADKPFASGLGIVDRALVDATCDAIEPVDPADPPPAGTTRLVDIDVRGAATVETNTDSWHTDALRDSATGSVRFVDHPVSRDDVIGGPDWYLDRVGFWHGACGPAACWAGAAAGLVDAAESMTDDNPHRRAHLGGMRSDAWALAAVLRAAGDEIDDDPANVERARARALSLRQTVERHVADILDRFSRSLGPRPFVGDGDVSQRWADTHLYVRQHHAERDLEVLGRG